jgi:hypothetical protein
MRVTIEPQGPPEETAPPIPLGRRLIWFVGIALASTLVTGVVAYGLKALLPAH